MTSKRAIALTELGLVLPATLFMSALFLRSIQPAPFEPAQTARHLVEWFSARPVLGLQVFLIALPLIAFVIGCVTLQRSWRADTEFRRAIMNLRGVLRGYLANILIAGATLLAACILGIVAVHLIAD